MGRVHPVLFVIGILVAGISLIRIGMVYGRKPSTEQIAEHPQPTSAATAPQQQPKTYRVTEEVSKSVTEGNRTVTVTVHRIIEVSVAMLICVGVGSQFIPTDRAEYPQVSSTTLPSSDSDKEVAPSATTNAVAPPRPDAVERAQQSAQTAAAPNAPSDSDEPVWVATNSNKYVCYGWDWKRYTKTSDGKWMKQSQARKQHKKPDRESCE
jgi:hypothetical protein